MEYKSRSDVPEKYKWDLEDIYITEQDCLYNLDNIKDLLNKVVSFKGKIMESSDSLFNFYRATESLDREFLKVFMYSHLYADSDTTNDSYKKLKMKIDKLSEEISTKTSFVTPELLKEDYSKVLEYIKENKALEEYKFDLEKIFRYKDHTLSEREEEIITEALNTFGTPEEAFYNFDNADIKLGKIKNEDGKIVEVNHSNYIKFMNSKDRNVRKKAFQKMFDYYKNFKNTIAALSKGNIKEDFFLSKLKKFNSPLEMSLYNDNISVEVYKTLINTVHNNLDLMYDYMSIRKKALKLDSMHMWDIYVDLVNIRKEDIPFEEGKEILFKALRPLGDTYIEDLKKAFTEKWIDVYPSKGKKSGAYSWGSYDTKPYLLLNYNNTIDSLSTMAHELGHSMHSFYSKTQNYIDSHYPIFLAEIASTVNEVILNDYLYKTAKTKEEKILYLCDFLDKVRTTIYRQTMFAEFEMIMHDKEASLIPLTEKEFSDTYYKLNKLYYGKEVISDDLIRYEWARIPHFYTSFYVYKYATGLSAALSIASRILKGDSKTCSDYIEFLKSGGNDYPLEILKKVGVDMTTPKPIEDALSMFKDKLEELKELL